MSRSSGGSSRRRAALLAALAVPLLAGVTGLAGCGALGGAAHAPDPAPAAGGTGDLSAAGPDGAGDGASAGTSTSGADSAVSGSSDAGPTTGPAGSGGSAGSDGSGLGSGPLAGGPVAAGTTATGGTWSQKLRARGKPDVATVLRKAPARGAVTLVTVKDVDGRPVISRTVAKDRTTAADAVQRQLDAPDVLDVSVGSKVAVLGSPDPYANQWALTTLDVQQAWATQLGTGVTVAVVDTGVYGTHPDLAGVVLPGKDYITPGGNGWADGHGHGTHVAGIVAALANNGIGTAGLAQGVRILPVRALDNQGSGSDADVASGIVWATDNGAKVINLSIGSSDYSTAEAAAIAYATQRGVVVVAAAGNQRDQGNETSYPGAFPGVIAVAATDSTNTTLSFSNTGPYVDLAAPGAAIISSWPPNGYQAEWGTSMATPFVSAAAALVKAAAPTLTPAQVTTVLEQTAKDLEAPGRDDASGYGLVQPTAAILAARRLTASATPSGSTTATPSPSVTLPAATFSLVSASTRVAYKGAATVTFALASAGRPVAGAAVAVCFTPAGSGAPTCRTTTTDVNGRASATQPLTVNAIAYARFAGTAAIASATSARVAIAMLPTVQATPATGALTVQVAPVSGSAGLTLQRLVGTSWTTAGLHAMPVTGRYTFTRLAAGTYRVAVSASPLHAAAVSRAVKVG